MKKRILPALFGSALVLIFAGCKESKEDPVIAATIESYFDLAYLASNGFEDLAKTKPTSDGKPVRVLKDVVGGKDAKWMGIDVPSPIWTTPPLFHNDEMGGYILVPNVSYTWWLTDKFAAIPQPYDVYIVMRDLQAVPYEGYISAGIGIRNKDDHLEVKVDYNDATGFHSSLGEYPTNSGVPVKNQISILRLQVNGANTKLFINNKQIQGTLTTHEDPPKPSATTLTSAGTHELGYGTLSHAAQHDFYGMWIKFGALLSDADHEYVYGKLSEVFKPGSYPSKPIADQIKVTWNNSTKSWNAAYTYVSPDGTAEDKIKTEYRWGYHRRYLGNGAIPKALDLDQTTFFTGTTATAGATFPRSAFPVDFGKGNKEIEVFVQVKVYDTKGNSWDHMVRSQFVVDDIP